MYSDICGLVRERDHGFCLLCRLEGQRNQGTEVHHILPRGKCVGQWWYLRQDERNLVLLCAKHHHPSPSREEAKTMLTWLRARYGYEYNEVPFRRVLEEM
ncbi:MAG: HNH endonuclease [Dehalococcoidia bacterium]|jgi:5-methylcytosine-specific restriction endonuclease McrA